MAGFTRKDAKIVTKTKPKRDKFADADKALDGDAFEAGASTPSSPPPTKAPTPQASATRDLSPHNERGLAGRVGYSMYESDIQALDSIRHRLYMQGVRLNSSEAARFAIAVLNSNTDKQLLSLHKIYGPSRRKK